MSNQYKLRFVVSILFAIVVLLIVSIQLIGATFAIQIPGNFVGTLFYFAYVLLIFIIYSLIKSKLRKTELRPRIKRYIKYAYIGIIIILTRVLALFIFGDFSNNFNLFEKFSGEILDFNIYKQVIFNIYNFVNQFINIQAVSIAIINIIITIVIALLIRKIISKTTRSPLTADIGTILFITYPKYILMTTVINYEIWNLLLTLLIVYLVFNIIKYCKRIEYNKYFRIVLYSCIIGVLISLDLLISGNILIWLIFFVLVLFSTRNVETFNIKIPRSIENKVNEKVKDVLYKVQRINISKLLFSIVLVFIVILISSPLLFLMFSGGQNKNMFGYKSYSSNYSFGSIDSYFNIARNNISDEQKLEVNKYLISNTERLKNVSYKESSRLQVSEAIGGYSNRSFVSNMNYLYNKLCRILKNDIDYDSSYIYALNNGKIVSSLSGASNFINVLIFILLFLSELANILLRRKNDLYTIVVKIAFLCSFLFTLIFSANFYMPVSLQIFAIMLLVLNVGNIYFNREDRIKMIGSKIE